MRIAIYATALNEILHVPRFLKTCAAADAIIVADTGSTDGTVEALRAGGAIVHAISIKPWRFDTARNAALSLVPADIDICISLDIDEVLNQGWRQDMETNWRAETTRGHYLYAFTHLPDGSPDHEFWQDKIHARYGYIWRHPCHEAVYPDLRTIEKRVYFRHLRIDHWPDTKKTARAISPAAGVRGQGRPPQRARRVLSGAGVSFPRQARTGGGRAQALPHTAKAELA